MPDTPSDTRRALTLQASDNGNRGMVGAEANLERWLTGSLPSLTTGESKFGVAFDWEVEKLGVPGAIIVKNYHAAEFLLKTITLDDVPGRGTVTFVANSWVYPVDKYRYSRVFFSNDTYLPSQMPAALKPYRDDELRNLRGDDQQGPYKEHDRVYRYDVYNDLGEPDRGNPRPVLGGSAEHPYPRRCRTGRKPTNTDTWVQRQVDPLSDRALTRCGAGVDWHPNSESALSLVEQIYVPRDERFGHLKMSDFLGASCRRCARDVDTTPGEFNSFQDILNLYEGGIKLPKIKELDDMLKLFPLQLVKDLLPTGGDYLLKLPIPQIIQGTTRNAWRTDEEFAREVLAGVNPMMITRLTVSHLFYSCKDRCCNCNARLLARVNEVHAPDEGVSSKSTLDPSKYGDQTSTNHGGAHREEPRGLTVQQALRRQHGSTSLTTHDRFIAGNFIYATRTLFFLRADGRLEPYVDGKQPHHGQEQSLHACVHGLAKAYVAVNDSGWHQLISHWYVAEHHAVMEPFVIATNRQLSVTHPTLINAGGIFEMTVFPGQSWNFTEQGLPADLLKRGPLQAAAADPGLPYATDGLAIWHAIEQWVSEYLSIYYPDDATLQGARRRARRPQGRAMVAQDGAVSELAGACTTIIWVASALHAAVNFGQYPYAGYLPNRPTVSRRRMPEPGTDAYAELERDPELGQIQTIIGISLIEILSKHSSDEVYLGKRDTAAWTSDARALAAFQRFSDALVAIEGKVVGENRDPQLKNRSGPAEFPTCCCTPNTSDRTGAAAGLTAKGIPNSISI
ncbi:hypothetical protein HU200_012840 [Digitaria exilis]|uniref:Lipoxygenase n=1 Tax=Digitaria exilis TaxID=1010633 RepID=A0A835FFK5_9POAL|nr:hypothetical protein HU200_012840 [Digitaria exilis]